MGQITVPPPVKLFAGILTSVPGILPDLEARLTALFGAIDLRSPEFPFDMTHYYDADMGSPIRRFFIAFRELVSPAAITGIKEATNGLETALAGERNEVRRPVNLDPGYLEESKIVLASTKNFYHRILLAGGIYGEVTLRFSGGSWQSFPWSFPDFRSGRYDEFFTQLRHAYREQLRQYQHRRGTSA